MAQSTGSLKTPLWVGGADTEMRTQYLPAPLADDITTAPSEPVNVAHGVANVFLLVSRGDTCVCVCVCVCMCVRERERKMFYLTTHSTHFIYGYMASDIWLRTILIVRKETRCRPIGYSYRLTARVLLYAPSYRQDNTFHGLCYTGRGALAGTRNSSMGPPHEGSIQRPIAP